MHWVSSKHGCGCARSGNCRIAWSRQREIFDGFVDTSTPGMQVMHMRNFRELLKLLHPDSLSEDDIDSGEVALNSVQGTISWFHFEKWHGPYFEEKRQEFDKKIKF
jgi:hypothetical protein